ncbi:50S ribosomal protein L21 [Patescibacteria group bacterium]|nr:50S ribosomal protein L21 [Patescibacteria group bacterium]
MNLAVIKTGGKQYKVKTGDKLKIDKIEGKEGDKVSFETLLISDDKATKVETGKPKLAKKIEAKIIKQGKDKKLTIVKYKRKVRYRRKQGFTKLYTQVEIGKI